MADAHILAQQLRGEWKKNPLHDSRTRESRALANERRDGLVYFIGGDNTPVKIGYSTAVEGRLRSLQASHWCKLKILAAVSACEADEREYHRRFTASRLSGEWFSRTPELEAEIARLSHLEESVS